MYMGDLFTTRFGPKGPSSGNTFIKITEELLGYDWCIHKSHLYTHHSLFILVNTVTTV
jgi:hypothetical protein